MAKRKFTSAVMPNKKLRRKAGRELKKGWKQAGRTAKPFAREARRQLKRRGKEAIRTAGGMAVRAAMGG